MKKLAVLWTIVLITLFALQSRAQQPPELPLRDIFFDQGESVLREDAKPVLRESAEVLAKNPGVDVEIVGYCNPGEYDSNPGLGKERAESAKIFLVGEGISSKRISMSGECGSGDHGDIDSSSVQELKSRLDSRVQLKAIPQPEPGLL